MRKLAGLTALTFLWAAACTGTVEDVEIHTVHLYSDSLGALLSQECVALYKEEGCSRYPNPMECETMDISIMATGRTEAACKTGGKVTSRFVGGVADGLPFVCHATPDAACQQCSDIYGATVFDNCTRGATLYRARGGGWNQLPDGSGWLGVPDDVEKPKDSTPTQPPDNKVTPPQNSGGKCDPVEARKKYAENLNRVLKQEGLNFTYNPDLSKTYDTKGGYWGYGGYSDKSDMCKYWLTSNSKLTTCWNPLPGKCHCMDLGVQKSCRCARINVFALRDTCKQIPSDCDYKAWVGNMVMEYGVATNWLFSGTYKKTGYYGGLPSTPGSPPPPDKVKCLGSPLVLDLGGDGIEATSTEGGVEFDLVGTGKMKTAWVRGNDALLVLDRNGNGIVDDGTELFGSATDVGGAPAADGFEAIAGLDTNGNGIVEENDLQFGELKVWRDANGDGLSQRGELTSLREAGVIGLEITGRSCGHVFDRHGNDLSLRASFIRADGRKGLMVDVFFGAGG